MGLPSSAVTPALSARKGSPLSCARASKIAAAIGLRHTPAVQTKRIFFTRFSLASVALESPIQMGGGSSTADYTRSYYSEILGFRGRTRVLEGWRYAATNPGS